MSGVILILLTLAAILVAGWRLSARARLLFDARPSHRTDQMARRLTGALEELFTQRLLLKRPLSGTIHAVVLASFVVLLTAILQAYIRAFLPGFHMPAVVEVAQDICAVTMLAAVALALYHRLVMRPARYEGSNKADGLTILALIASIVMTMELEFVVDALQPGASAHHPLATLIASAIPAVPGPLWVGTTYWLHIGVVLLMLMYIPGSKHLHMFAAFPTVVMRNLEPRGRADEPVAGANRVTDLSRKAMLDLHSCTECGRCQDACPAYAEGLPLSPKRLIMDMRDDLASAAEGAARPLAGDVIAPDTLWACTTCSACMEVCPVHIEHLPKIIDMRRTLVEQTEMPAGLQQVLQSYQKNGNSFAKPARQRPKWAADLGFEIPDAREEPVDYLWFVGDYASYHPLVTGRTRNMARLLHQAGVSFGILYDAEKSAGNDVRRLGEEGLFSELATENAAALAECTFNTIVTTDPHTLNTLTNEYAAYGLDKPVIHYTQLLSELVEAGRIARSSAGEGRVATYHDPCYLGRYNGRYDAPRALIGSRGYRLHEMARCRENSFCCGAGGGRIFMTQRGPNERPSESRIREAMEIPGVELFVVACPKDLVMYTAAADTLGVADRLKVVEITDLFVA